MKRRLISSAAALAAALAVPVITAPAASADGKASIYNCSSRTMTSDQRSLSVVCNPAGTIYRFEVQCSWYSAGQGGSYWVSSPWTKDGSRATASCGSAYVTGVGATVYYR
ncbi:hypothetical protein MM440_05960 [Arsenicicoccus piscis]|uniref:Ig-like domain-containing protein n=1 Tax=Arsenicicoccus piscis TaxID=673954 RepID=A0ABQ6HVD6_9MICO|nr:hypothetical protein [Arsenicicoccus piscis]MCH8627338.1 hypothetical protein [Arsenicicoccus piscis]GMA21484.1 hypothetical protein GCM10025862_35050 [Arsenicicoccus piscis]